MTRLTLCSAACALLMTAASPAGATSASEAQQACMPDVLRLCTSAIPDVTRIVACLKREKPRLSPACRDVISSK
jgi:hypothetical protein